MDDTNSLKSPDDTPSEVSSLRDLALRLLRNNPSQIKKELIFVKALPQDLPVTLPWPDKFQLYGSYLWREKRTDVTSIQFIRVLFDSPLSPKEILDFYHQQLIQADWEEADRRIGGFVPDFPLPDHRRFSFSEQRLDLEVQTYLTDDNATAVSLRLTQILQPEGYSEPEYHTVIPELKHPPAVYIAGPAGAGGGSHHASSEAIVESDIGEVDQIALLRDYGNQLRQFGWTLVEETQMDQAVESKWQLQSKTGANWQGILTIARIPGTRARYDIHVEAEKEEKLKTSPDNIHILIVDSHAETRRNIKMIFSFESEFESVGFASSSEEAIRQATRLQPDVMLIGFPLPDMDRLDQIAQLSSQIPDTSFVVVVPEDAISLQWAALSRVVKAVLVKPPVIDALIEAIRYASHGDKQSPQRLYD